jgi:hypothetical protein
MEDFFESELNLIIRTKNVVNKNIQTNVAVNLMFERTNEVFDQKEFTASSPAYRFLLMSK